MIGIAFFEKKFNKKAKNSFINASKSKEYKDQGKAWLEYLNALMVNSHILNLITLILSH